MNLIERCDTMKIKKGEMHDMKRKCEIHQDEHLYKIGMFAQMIHLSVKTLRFYEEQGLLYPAYVNQDTGYRYYTLNQMATVHQIIALKQAGLTIEDIKKLHQCDDEKIFLIQKKTEIMEKIAELTKSLAMIESYLIEKDNVLDTPVLMKTIPSCLCATMSSTIECYDDLFELMPTMGYEMEKLGCVCACPEYCFTQYIKTGDKIMIETCEAVKERKEDSQTVQFKEFPTIQALCLFHKGSYDDFSHSYAIVMKYIENHNYEICGPIRESYIDGVWNKDDEKDWLTEIQIPVIKR